MIWFLFVLKKTSFDWSGGIETGIKNHLKTYPTNWEESRKPEIFNLKTFFFLFSISQKASLIDRILKNQKFWKTWKIFCRNICKPIFMIWDACSWFQMFYKSNLSKKKFNPKQISSNISFLTPPKSWKATKINTQSHVQSLTMTCLWCVQIVSVWLTQKVICRC